MGYYFNPPQDLKLIGRELIRGSFHALQQELEKDEILMGLYDRGHFMNAVHLFSISEFDAFEDQVRNGVIFRLGFFAINPNLPRMKEYIPHWYGMKK